MDLGSELIAKGDLPCQLPVRLNSSAFHCLACSCWVVGSRAIQSVYCQPAVSQWGCFVAAQASAVLFYSVGDQQQQQEQEQNLGSVPRAGWRKNFGVTGGLLQGQATLNTGVLCQPVP